MVRILRGGAALAVAVAATFANAAGLGKLTVNSALGQVLNAEIDLVALQPGEEDSLSAHVASPEAFRDARIEYSPVLRSLRFSVEKRPNGAPYLKVTSQGPVNEPFVDVLIEVTWPAGRLQREYPILLDPPGYAQSKPVPPTVAAAPTAPSTAAAPPAKAAPSAPAPSAQAPATTQAPAASTAPAPSGAPSASRELAASSGNRAAPAAPAAAPGSDTYGPVQNGDTLARIAENVKPASVSLEQMLVALYRENKGAFVNNNMNRLKTGQILKVPSTDEVQKIENKDATREYRTHVADWKAYRDQLASGAAAIPTRPESTNAASGRVSSAAVTPPPAANAPSGDVLRLSKSEGGNAASTRAGGQDRLNAMQEELTAKDKALRESQSRVADLEKQIRDMQRLVELKGGAPGKADNKVAVAPPPPATKPAEAPKAEVKPAEPPKPAPVTPAEPTKPAVVAESSKPAEAAKPGESKTTTTTTTTTTEAGKNAPPPPPKVAENKAAPQKAPKQPVAPPPSFVDDLTENPYVLGGIGALVLGLGAILFMRRRRNRELDETPSHMTSSFPSDLKQTTGTGRPAAGLVDTGNSSFLTDFDKTGPGTIDTDEVDPVAEAEVYIAYGRDAQAEEILKEAMARDRTRHEIPLKLLEIYHARKSATAFETVARELRNNVGEDSPLWHKAAAMGVQIDPNNPLYSAAAHEGSNAGVAPAVAAATPRPDLDFDVDASHARDHATHVQPSFDLDLDAAHKAEQHKPPASLDFDLDHTPHAHAPIDVPLEHAKEEKHAFDFDLSSLDFPGSKTTTAPDLDLGNEPSHDLNLADLNLETESAGAESEGVGTKLELAKAYLEIGDKDGAREILQEVAKEGSNAQRAEAEKLMATL